MNYLLMNKDTRVLEFDIDFGMIQYNPVCVIDNQSIKEEIDYGKT